jgi:hypothetical protein
MVTVALVDRWRRWWIAWNTRYKTCELCDRITLERRVGTKISETIRAGRFVVKEDKGRGERHMSGSSSPPSQLSLPSLPVRLVELVV